MKSLEDSDPQERLEAVFALGAIGTDATGTVPALGAILVNDPDENVRVQAALALTKLVPASGEAVPALASALQDKVLHVRMHAALALLRLGSASREALPALIQAVKDKSNQTNLNKFHVTIQQMAMLALGRASADTAEGVPTLKAVLEADKRDEMQVVAARALGDVGPEARAAVPLLQGLLKSKNALVRECGENALEKIGK